jgi:L-histidine N-alpha-methyltransferase
MLDPTPLREEVGRGLASHPPTLPPKLFYDEEGARLFEKITRLPEYYLSRTEIQILRTHLPEIAGRVGPGAKVVEPGSGSGEKAELLLGALEKPLAYIPVDIAGEQLDGVKRRMARAFPEVRVHPVLADFTKPFRLPEVEGTPRGVPGRPLVFFPGSTIGNFEPPDARNFLRTVGASAGSGAALIIGFDLVKTREVLEAAYDDAAGVTAAFNFNALRHLNRLLGTDFRPECFRHRAVWNQEASRIEMHLVAVADQIVTLPSNPARFPEVRLRLRTGDHIVTEHSYKYTLEGFGTMAQESGWEAAGTWTDPGGLFAVGFLEWRGSGPNLETVSEPASG